MLNELNEIIESDDEEEGKEKLYAFIDKWGRLYRFIRILEHKADNYTYFLRFPKKIRSYFRTSNYMERCFKELKDYIRIRGYFQSEESANKFLYIFFKQKDEKYKARRLRYADILREALERY